MLWSISFAPYDHSLFPAGFIFRFLRSNLLL